jgi:type IV secretion system protein TrbL
MIDAQLLFAEQNPNNVLDGIVNMYRSASGGWQTVLASYATRLFWLLAVIDFAWTSISLALKRADISEFFAEIVRRIIFVGFYLALIQNAGTWPQMIVNSFREAAAATNGTVANLEGISPSEIFDLGIKIAATLTDVVSFSDPGESLARIITSLVVVIVFAIVAGCLLVALVEMYIALNAGILLLGFGGSRWTSDYATKYMSYVISVGVKLFAMQLIIGIGENFVAKAFAAYEGTNGQSLVFVGVAVVLFLLVHSIPTTLQGIISGAALHSGGGNIGSLATSGMASAFTGLAAGAGGAMAVAEAAKLARSSKDGSMPSTSPIRAIGHLAGAAIGDIGARLAGNPAARSGTMGGRMAARLREERLSQMAPSSDSTNNNSDTPGKEPQGDERAT